ncbi:Tripartite-type tricarboxylate transporter, receptor component TctC [Polynucleobacter kasalickyi]|uniref:Tripartite-type tricarboxylate transporter, receptor component TctC n=2 Tax=Polynucleobacter kasalickyi TaxID=1938817 RepID=A0A1W2A2N7_9BURK|nr:Tripartite-type tricarboxylate transporter, receptor component TctC [Polynucleobacter kasalickyi]
MKKNKMRPYLVQLCFFLSLLCCIKAPYCADYPNKPIKLVVPFSPGGGNDSVARVVAAKLTEKLGQQVFIDNKPGAGGTLGADFSAKSPADGYTIFLGGIGSLAINPVFNKSLPYHPTKDFEPIILLAEAPLIVVATPKLPVNSIQQLTEYMKTHPTQINYASNGNGSSAQLAAMMYESMANVKMVHVPYKGLAPALSDLLSGQVQIMFSSMVAIAPIVTSNRLKALAVTSKKRSSAFPQIPTMVEAGFPEYSTGSWYGLLAPAGTPLDIILKINRAANSCLQDPSVKEQLLKEGAEPIGGTSQQFKKYIQSELDKTLYLFNQQKLDVSN